MPSNETAKRNRARDLRRNATDAEKELWWHLRRRLPLAGTYFRRQVALGPYFVDFACLKHKLIIELDGDQHGQPDAQRYDDQRTRFLEQQGFVVLRFWNHEVFTQIDGVLEAIARAIAERGMQLDEPSPPTPLHKGEGRRTVSPLSLVERGRG